MADRLTGDGLDDVGAGDVHVADLIDHDRHVGERGGVDRTAGRGPHDQRDLRDDAGGGDVEAEDLGEEGDRADAFLDTGAAGVVDADDRAAELERKLLHLDDLASVRFGERPAEDREVVSEDRDGLAFDRAQAADHTVTVGTIVLHPELVVVVAGEFVDLLEGIVIEESVDAFTGGLLAALVLIVHRALVAGVSRVPALDESVDAFGCSPWGIRHASTITMEEAIIVHSHQKNLEWTGEQPTPSSSRRRRLRAPRSGGPWVLASASDLGR